ERSELCGVFQHHAIETEMVGIDERGQAAGRTEPNQSSPARRAIDGGGLRSGILSSGSPQEFIDHRRGAGEGEDAESIDELNMDTGPQDKDCGEEPGEPTFGVGAQVEDDDSGEDGEEDGEEPGPFTQQGSNGKDA